MAQVEKTDYNVYFVETGQRPQNFIRFDHINERYNDQPKQQELIDLKSQLLKVRNHPAMYLKKDIRDSDLESLGLFDVIVIDPPWNEYFQRAKYHGIQKDLEKAENWSLQDIMNIPIEKIIKQKGFLFLWCATEHLDDGWAAFKKWGFKRCEEITWIKSNINQSKSANQAYQNPSSFFIKTKEHCLLGISDSNDKQIDPSYVHPNIDSDVILSEQDDFSDPKKIFQKPAELCDLVERFCMGWKRLMLFGYTQDIRDGWLVVGKDLIRSNYDQEKYQQFFQGEINMTGYQGGEIVGTTEQIEWIWPKSPPKM